MTAATWEPGKPWTHPSIVRLTDEELRAKYDAARQRFADDMEEFAGVAHPDLTDLFDSDSWLVHTYYAAMQERGINAS